MRFFCLSLSLFLLGPGHLFGQVNVEIVLDQDRFLPSESLPVAIRISNRSGQTLQLGSGEEWLSFSVQSRDGLVVLRSGESSVAGEFSLDSSKIATKRVDLASSYNLTKPGRYTVTATVRVKEWDRQFSSKPRNFEIIPGTKLWEQEFGVPRPANSSNADPEVRKYALQQANYLKQLKLYVRLTDVSESRVFRVFAVGPMFSVSRPEPQLDKLSNLHLFWQTGAHSFTYIVVNPDGDMSMRRTYDLVNNSRPRLKADADGKWGISGGARRMTREDFPEPESSPSNESKTPKSE